MTGLTSFAVNTSTLDFTGINLRGAAPPTYSYLASWKLSVRDAKSSTENGSDPSSDCRSQKCWYFEEGVRFESTCVRSKIAWIQVSFDRTYESFMLRGKRNKFPLPEAID